MSRSVNKAIIIGHLGGDPELRHTVSNIPVCNFTVATNETWVKDGEKQERTEWHLVVAWRKLAEICHQYLRKGKQVYIEGKLQTRDWEDQNGQKRYTTEIVADEMVMLGGEGQQDTQPQTQQEAAMKAADDRPTTGGDNLPF